MIGKTIDELSVGDAAEFAKTISETDVYLFAGITGDLNPAHINQAASEKTFFKGRIAHGMLSAGLISAVLGMQLPGPGSIYLSQDLRFKAPVKIGDTITARVEVVELMKEKKRVKLSTTCTNQDGTIVLEGEALVMPPRPE
jgi:3-hydroxybutyryl-CoA dehydratase